MWWGGWCEDGDECGGGEAGGMPDDGEEIKVMMRVIVYGCRNDERLILYSLMNFVYGLSDRLTD